MRNVGKFAAFICCFLLVTAVNAQPCGNTLDAPTGNLQSSNYPFPLSEKTICNWTFALNASEIKLVYFSVEVVELAEQDHIYIYDGYEWYNYTGDNAPRNFMAILSPNSSTVRIEIGPDAVSSPRRFLASYRTTDAMIYTMEHSGLIKSPRYSKTAGDMSFTWVITARPETSIYLSFVSFNISTGNLTITDGSNQFNFTGSTLPNDIATTTANVKISLEMPLEELGLSFELLHSTLHPNCSKLMKMENVTEFEVDFTGLEIEATFNIRCFVIVEVAEDVVLSAAVKTPDAPIPESSTLITLHDGGSLHSPSMLVYSPSTQLEVPRDVLTSGNRLWVGYSTLSKCPPVNVTVHVTVHNSGKHLRGSGSFQLPQQMPNSTLTSNTSVYVLSVAADQQVVANVDANASLSGDNYILFYDSTAKGKLLANFTASVTFYPIISSSNQLHVVANNFKGNDTFSASFVAAPKGENFMSSDKLGSFQLNSINANTSYSWIIAPLGMNSSAEVIALTINSAALDDERSLLIYNGTSRSAVVLYTLTNSTTSAVVVHIDTAEGAMVVLRNKGNGSSGVIVDASYQLQAKCEFSLNLTSINGTTFSSPNFPSIYPANAQCRWNIATPTKQVYLVFESLNLPSSQPIQIFSAKDGNLKFLRNVSGDGIVDDIITDEAPLLLVWSSSVPLHNLTVSTGFQIRAFPLDCGGVFNESSSHEFQTPKYPDEEKNTTLCVWAVTLPPKKGDDVEIIDLAFEAGKLQKSSADLVIHEGGSLQSQSANMSAINQTSFLSRTNKLLIRYMYTADSAGGSSYKFTYNQHLCDAKQLCQNQLCMHESWRCNGVNDCGDFSDEFDCAASPVNPPVPEEPSTAGVSVAAFVVVMFVMLILGGVIAIGGPMVWRKFRTQGSYQEFRNTADA